MQGRAIFPGAGHLELARAAASRALHGVFFLQPLAVEAAGLRVECVVGDDGRFDVRSGADGAVGHATVHCSGALGSHDCAHFAMDWVVRGRSCLLAANLGALYDGYEAVGLQYGPCYRTLVRAWGGASVASARLWARSTHEGTAVHPADLDDALCASALIASGGGGGETRLPFAVDDALVQGAVGEAWAVRLLHLQAQHRVAE